MGNICIASPVRRKASPVTAPSAGGKSDSSIKIGVSP